MRQRNSRLVSSTAGCLQETWTFNITCRSENKCLIFFTSSGCNCMHRSLCIYSTLTDCFKVRPESLLQFAPLILCLKKEQPSLPSGWQRRTSACSSYAWDTTGLVDSPNSQHEYILLKDIYLTSCVYTIV